MTIYVRPAISGDAADIVAMLRGLAAVETAIDDVTATPENVHAALVAGALKGLIAADDTDGNAAVGLLLWEQSFTSWAGAPAVRVLDLYVSPDARGRGVGTELFRAVQMEGRRIGASRLDWWVRTDNVSGQAFYTAVGAHQEDGWENWRIELV